MPDDLTKKGNPDRKRVNLHQGWEVEYSKEDYLESRNYEDNTASRQALHSYMEEYAGIHGHDVDRDHLYKWLDDRIAKANR